MRGARWELGGLRMRRFGQYRITYTRLSPTILYCSKVECCGMIHVKVPTMGAGVIEPQARGLESAQGCF